MRKTDDIDTPVSGGLSRRSVIKAGAHAAWVIPAVQVVAAAPAFANCSTPGAGGSAPVMTVSKTNVALAWGTQGNSYYLKITVTACAANDRDDCAEKLTGLKVSITTNNKDVDLQEHSTRGDNPGTLWTNSGHAPSTGRTTTQIYTSTYEIPEGTCITTAPVQVRAADGDGTFTGSIDVVVENDQGGMVTVTKTVPKHP